MSEIEWKEPPPPIRGDRPPSFWGQVANECRKRPGQWALAKRDAYPQVGTYVRKHYGLEARTVSIPGTKRADIYVRWVEVSA